MFTVVSPTSGKVYNIGEHSVMALEGKNESVYVREEINSIVEEKKSMFYIKNSQDRLVITQKNFIKKKECQQ